MASFQSPSIYVGDLDGKVTEAMLYDHFRTVGPVVSVRVCIDSQTHKSLGYGYVNFQAPADADKAIDQLNGSKIPANSEAAKGCRVARIQRDPTQRKSGVTNVVVKGLPAEMDGAQLKESFGNYGRIVSIKVPTDEKGLSRGYAYIMYEKEESAKKAVEEMNGMAVEGQNEGQTLIVERYKNPAAIREEQLKNYNNLYIKNLAKSVTDEILIQHFEKFGKISSAKVREAPTEGAAGDGNMGFGFVAFEEHEDAVKAKEALDDAEHELAAPEQKLSVRRFMNKKERQRAKEQAYRERQQQYAKYPNLYVKNFDDTVSNDQLKEAFEQFGPTISVKIESDRTTGISRGFGFVSFKEHSAAQKAVTELAGSRMLGSRPLFVTYALRRDARLQQFEEIQKKRRQPVMNQPPLGLPGGLPGAGFHGAGAGFPGPMPGMYPPGPRALRPPVGGMPPHGMPPGGMPGMPGMPGAPQPMPQRMPPPQPVMPRPAPKPAAAPAHPTGLDAQYLASMTPEQQKNVLGERLYTYIVKKFPKQSAKITGMLLEMDNSEILNLLDSPALLDSKVDEAIEVLDRHTGM